ncbi:family 43 glycosylhydrolase [Paenibacillus daejeonensis]|uniref:family 43 glycosylhydrolase n=1 Tax=Paenibacillus daejeonensis TaxID=135193 RepID=UPI00037F6721|nr:family 43 glycosylhydrolase [Paenibacillus daejeonensis]
MLTIKNSQEQVIKVMIGEPLHLPEHLKVELSGGVQGSLPVEWEPIDASRLETPGSFVVEGTYQEREYPQPLILNRADPFVIKHTDGYYYFTASVPEYDRLVLRRARTIVELAEAEETVIWTKHNAGEMGNHIWAPELHRIDGKWYIYFAAGSAEDKWAIRPYVLECADANPLTGTWVEKGRIQTPIESFSLDATTFEHRGERYLAWAQIIESSSIYIARMDTPWSIATEPVLIAAPEHDWEIQGHRVNEGAAVIIRNGRVFMAYSASATDDRYCVGLLTADESSDLLDPASWTKTPQPVFSSCESTSQYGPGHNSFTVSEDGSADLMVYHARSYKEIDGEPLYDPNRHTRVQQLLWNTDGTPYFGHPGQQIDTSGERPRVRVIVEMG